MKKKIIILGCAISCIIIIIIGLSVGLSKKSSSTNASGSTYLSVEMKNFGKLMSLARLIYGCENMKNKSRSNFENSIKDILVSMETIGSFINKSNINIYYSCRYEIIIIKK
jgi:hypothetical protein